MVTLGHWYRDEVCGIVGVAVARIEHWHGAPEVKLEWLGVNDDDRKETWVYEGRLAEVSAERAVGFARRVDAAS